MRIIDKLGTSTVILLVESHWQTRHIYRHLARWEPLTNWASLPPSCQMRIIDKLGMSVYYCLAKWEPLTNGAHPSLTNWASLPLSCQVRTIDKLGTSTTVAKLGTSTTIFPGKKHSQTGHVLHCLAKWEPLTNYPCPLQFWEVRSMDKLHMSTSVLSSENYWYVHFSSSTVIWRWGGRCISLVNLSTTFLVWWYMFGILLYICKILLLVHETGFRVWFKEVGEVWLNQGR